MAFFETTLPRADGLSRLIDAAARHLEARRAERARRANYRDVRDQLSQMSNADLADIGIAREAIPDVAYEHVYGRS